jgi:hypothetical protein
MLPGAGWLGGKVIARDEVAGLACEVWEVPALNAKLWLRDSPCRPPTRSPGSRA